MGWDAAATKNGALLAIASRYVPEYWSIEDLPLREAFAAAARCVRDAVGTAPEYLDAAQLSGTHDRVEFERAFAMRFADIPCGVLVWSAGELRERFAHARWAVPDDSVERLSYWTVKEFVTACVENELGVHFGW